MRIGNGFDIHRLEAGIPLIIGGVQIAHDKGSAGHSDGDVVVHSIIDALLGALALGDIGMHFPPSDQSIKGIDSMVMLKKVMAMLAERRYEIINVDATIVLESPKLSRHFSDMRKRLASVLQIDEDRVSVKAKTAEKLGSIGDGDAIAAYAVCLIQQSQ
ncbi:MAG: 2-C-methyl-D-erythritol 2,4-cyclodiphosphate synthase [Candidatus Obscuribacterales bacterium]|nr:2-C-methyl-D-erythritol 2,4-cyclodiphosphate synthase [Candidatus Obscuribacterales bacterium]